MASPLQDVPNTTKAAAQSVFCEGTSIATSTSKDGLEQGPKGGVEHSRDTVSSSTTNGSNAEKQSTAASKSEEDGKAIGRSNNEANCSEKVAGETHFDPLDGDDRVGATEQQITAQASFGPLPSQLEKPSEGPFPRGISSEDPHPQTAKIVRQAEYYFSDNNLVNDAHLLARTGPTGDGWVSVNEIMGFKKMRQYKPRNKVKAAIATSQMLEVNGKFIRRKSPLTVAPKVKPHSDPKRERDRILQEKPWLTKNMLEPTGFEEYATDGPITPAEFEEERRLFDPEVAFTTRIEYAAARFASRKKMHQASANIFSKFMLFGGFAENTHMFAGGLSKKELEEYDKEQILQMTAKLGVLDNVVHGLSPDSIDAGSWKVDFKGMAEAFLSSQLFQHFDWKEDKVLHETTNVIRKFYEYLLYHDACPDYEDDIHDAIEVCDLANAEVPKLAKLDLGLPGQFNTAASTIHNGFCAQVRPRDITAEWVLEGDRIGMTDKDAWMVFSAGVMAHGTEEQVDTVFRAHQNGKPLKVTTEEDIGLEIVRKEKASEGAKQIYGNDRIKGTFIKPTCKLYCKRWTHPGAAPRDVPPAAKLEEKNLKCKQYELILEEDVLEHCEPGMKLEANVSQLENGIMWLDLVENVYPTSFKWTLNERIRDWKEPGPPKGWIQRASGKAQAEESQDMVDHTDENKTTD